MPYRAFVYLSLIQIFEFERHYVGRFTQVMHNLFIVHLERQLPHQQQQDNNNKTTTTTTTRQSRCLVIVVLLSRLLLYSRTPAYGHASITASLLTAHSYFDPD